MTRPTPADIATHIERGAWRKLEKLAVQATHDAERLAGSRMSPVLGGGTRLMLALKHRISDDIDLFIRDPQWIGYLTPRKNDLLEDQLTGYDEGNNALKLSFPEGEIDFIVSMSLLGLPNQKSAASHFELEHPAEVLAKKLFYRGWSLTARDLFDWHALEEHFTPAELHLQEIATLLGGRLDSIDNALDVLGASARHKDIWQSIRTPQAPDFEATIQWAKTRIQLFRTWQMTPLERGAIEAMNTVKDGHGNPLEDHAYFDHQGKRFMVRQHRPGTFTIAEGQTTGEFLPRQTFMVIDEEIVCWGPEQDSRAEALPSIQTNAAGAYLTFAQLAIEAIERAGGNAAIVDWQRVEDDAMLKSMVDNRQPTQAVYEAIAEISPGAVAPTQQRSLRDRVMAMAMANTIANDRHDNTGYTPC